MYKKMETTKLGDTRTWRRMGLECEMCLFLGSRTRFEEKQGFADTGKYLFSEPLLWFGHGCSETRMLLEHERYYGLGMDALRPVCSWNTNVIMVWAWML